MRFVLPMPPNRANARGHWRVHHAAKSAYWNMLDNIQLAGFPAGFVAPKPPKAPLPKATAAATLYVWNLYDDNGAMALMKWPEDWLVSRGYIVNDNRKHLRWAGIPDQVIDRKNPRIVLTLEAVA